ncbi:MAG: response regulator [Clostridiales bacterium]|nr:response regulator [Clostridiales bacterium]
MLFWLGDQIPGGFFIYRADDAQEIVYVNRAVLNIFGCEDEQQFRDLTGYTFRGMVHPDDFDAIQASIDEQIADANNNNLDCVEYRIIRRDGEIRWLDDYGHFAHMPGYGNVYYVFISDVTEKRIAEMEKQELARQKHLSEVKNAFLFNISHDIRTPMNAIIGFSELARRHINDQELLTQYLDKMAASSRQLLALIDDMLEVSRLESGRITPGEEDADLREQIETAVDMHRLDAESRGITLQTRIDLSDVRVILDQSMFQRILGNLLSNAIKFTPAGGNVTVTACQKESPEPGFARYVFQVADTGIGISKEFLSRIYDSFERETTSTKGGTTGTGLGLTIVKSLLQLMGGTIACESEKGKGSTFTVEIPLKLAQRGTADGAEGTNEPRAAAAYRILIVEDIEFNRELAEELLKDAGFQVESVPDGCDAVEAVKRQPAGYYDLVLMDIQMPIMDGYEATRAIRSLPQGEASLLPIIALSANTREEDRRRSLESGMNCHMPKPYDMVNLINCINEHISSAGKPGRR